MQLEDLLQGIAPIPNRKDLYIWPFNKAKYFYVKTGYNILAQELDVSQVEERRKQVLSIVWEAKVPSKLKVFG